ncbi:TPA: Gfo/Idh/MocA family oxidoreductase [Clostridioides difficile]|uniref:Gfo/Idh/MocA family protein n=1 Tax=Clostridioides difficile TaxID=1496 RepID=UPI001C2938C2|nr:Gfo/Idh/MocA family oxidoreductase [Clostridioides difficile]EKG0823879.1 Gfo/Idh/MocA family oxidoreductase [Clostridioides difficile]EKJ1268296.1 Gfo/Idh/MocA family oxidoreductase [Clostridioides difficile]MCJ0223474.1 Gfo/Idh/MocA family oxidoreductase [Clostridioides difficile]MCJ0431010.1 Gfo/Idh/MocA family oxidoreductase [Clostridioides difficile]MCJ0437625.1 Gfo/Idh/MocA family oxidoreductase [Clostridioides difficile]
MSKIKIGIIGASDIAFRRFLPALIKNDKFEYVGIASRNPEKANKFVEKYKGIIFSSYDEIISSNEIDALYIPLPPALHYEWASKALESGKHVFLEKPFTTSNNDTYKLINLAKEKKLALHENYMFKFHSQLKYIRNLIDKKSIGEIRLIKTSFGFPMRESNDFRYNKKLGGGALFDCGGYTIKLASYLMGNNTRVVTSKLNYLKNFDVDIFGSAVLENEEGIITQVSFGMDNSYKCDLEVWGSKGCIITTRIFTAPSNFNPKVMIKIGNEEKIINLQSDDQFFNSINYFNDCINNINIRIDSYIDIMNQSNLIQNIIESNKGVIKYESY